MLGIFTHALLRATEKKINKPLDIYIFLILETFKMTKAFFHSL